MLRIHLQEKNGNILPASELTELSANGIKGLGMSESFTMGTPQRRPYKEITKVSMRNKIMSVSTVP